MNSETKTYEVLSALRYNGERYGPNIEGMNMVKMTKEQAAPLIPLKVLGDGKNAPARERTLDRIVERKGKK